MSIDIKFGRYCDECGRTIASAVRVHQGKDYCRACYQTTFIKTTCSKCSGSMRGHRHATSPPVCNECIRSERTCLRCGRFTLVAGKLVGNGAVCNSCALYFREKHPCTSCGRLSSRLSRPLFAGLQDRVCDRCRSTLTHATCSVCNRYRPIQGRDHQDKPYCKDCAPEHRLTHQCPCCGSIVNGGGLGRCIVCINTGAIRRDAEMTSAQLEKDWTRALWNLFVEEQIALGVENPTMRKRIATAANFFFALEKNFASQADINSSTLAHHIDSKLHRKYLLASRFVVAQLRLDDFTESRGAAAERRRIEDILTRSQGTQFIGLLVDFVAHLDSENTAPRTVRLYLRAAEAFCINSCASMTTGPWREQALVNHLKHFPGSANSLSRFVSHCKVRYEWGVQMPDRTKWKDPSQKLKKTLAVVKSGLQSASQQSVDEMSLKEVSRLLSAAMGIPATRLLSPKEVPVYMSESGAILVTEDGLIEPGDPLHPFAKRWADLTNRRAAGPNSARSSQETRNKSPKLDANQNLSGENNRKLRQN